MTLPAGVSPVSVSGRFVRPDGQPCRGKVTFTPSRTLTGPGTDPPVVIPPMPVVVQLDTLGRISVVLAATDDADLEPTPWTYSVLEEITGQTARSYSIALPASPAEVDLADLAPVAEPEDVETYDQRYVQVAGGTMTGALILEDGSPAASEEYVANSGGGGGGGSPSSTVVAETSYGASSSAGASATYARGDHTHGTPALPTPAAIGAATSGHAHAGTYLALASGGTILGPVDLQALLTLARLSMTSPDDDTTLITLTAPAASSTTPSGSADLLQMVQDGQPTWWLNENGNPRARAAKVDEAAERLYGLASQTADIFQVLRTRADPTVLACVKPNGNIEALGNLVAANYANSSWTVLTSNDADYTPVDSSNDEWQPAVRLVGAANETVQMRGRVNITNTVLNDTPFTLPSGFRPSKTVRISLANGQSTAIHASINSSGVMTIGRAVTSAGWLSFDGVQFSRI